MKISSPPVSRPHLVAFLVASLAHAYPGAAGPPAVWRFAGNPGPGGISLVHRDAESETLFVASGPPNAAQPFLWRSDDLGSSWIGLRSAPMDNLVSLTSDPRRSGGLYAVRHAPTGEYYLQVSDDSGVSWATRTLPAEERFAGQVIPVSDPFQVDGLYWPGLSLWYSADRGLTWERRSSLRLQGLTVRKDRAGALVAQVGYQFPGIVHSSDGGRTWSHPTLAVREGALFDFAPAPSEPTRLYGSSDRGILRSDDGGVLWRTVFDSEPTSCFRPVVERHDADAVALTDVCSGRLRTSDDGGDSWRTVPPPADRFGQTDFSELDIDDVWWVGRSLFHTTNGGVDWNEAPTEIPSAGNRDLRGAAPFVYALDRNPDPEGGIWRKRTDSAGGWSRRGVLPSYVSDWQADPARPAILYFGLETLPGFWRSDDGGATSRQVAVDFPRFVSEIVVRKRPGPAGARLWVGSDEDAWRSEDGGVHWKNISGPIPTGWDSDCHEFLPNCPFPSREIRQLAQDAGSPEVLYVERVDEYFATEDGGAHWRQLQLPDLVLGRLVADPVIAGTVYFLSGYPNELRRSTDRGRTWRRVRLPAGVATATGFDLRFEPGTGRPWLFTRFPPVSGTCREVAGVFALEGKRWVRLAGSLPANCVHDLLPVRGTGAAVHWFASLPGAGVWELER